MEEPCSRCLRLRRLLTIAVVAVGLALTAVWAVGLVRFAEAIPDRVIDTETRTDAIVVLTGGSERLVTGVQLLAENKAGVVFVSGVHPGVDLQELLKVSGQPTPDVKRHIETGHGAQDTAGNAAETAAWVRGHGYRSVRLVTASYHMPRSLLEFRRAMPEVAVIPHPVFPGHVKQHHWWRWPGTTALIVGEYTKFLWAWLDHGRDRSWVWVSRR